MSRITVIGSLNYDIIFKNGKVQGSPGGGCLNVAFNLHYLNTDYIFITELGPDHLGEIIKNELQVNKINHIINPTTTTNLAVGFSDHLTTRYSFYKLNFTIQPLPIIISQNTQKIIFLSGTASLTNTQNFIDSLADEIVVFDCNFRQNLVENQLENFLNLNSKINVIKKSDEDCVPQNVFRPDQIVCTTFSDGAEIQFQSQIHRIITSKISDPVSVVGAGDAFCAKFVQKLAEIDFKGAKIEYIIRICQESCDFAREKIQLPGSYFVTREVGK